MVTPSIRKGQEVVRRLQAEVRDLRKELAEVRGKLERFHVSVRHTHTHTLHSLRPAVVAVGLTGGEGLPGVQDGDGQRPATMSGLVHRQLTEDGTLKGTAELIEAARTRKANAERELNDTTEQLELVRACEGGGEGEGVLGVGPCLRPPRPRVFAACAWALPPDSADCPTGQPPGVFAGGGAGAGGEEQQGPVVPHRDHQRHPV